VSFRISYRLCAHAEEPCVRALRPIAFASRASTGRKRSLARLRNSFGQILHVHCLKVISR